MQSNGYLNLNPVKNSQGTNQQTNSQISEAEKPRTSTNLVLDKNQQSSGISRRTHQIFSTPNVSQTVTQNSKMNKQITNEQSKVKNKKRNKLYTLTLMVLFLKKVKKSIKKKKHREKILEEWYNTESSYNLDLKIAVNQIRKPMEEQKIISRDQALIMFPQFQGMIQLSNMMLDSISKARKINNPNKIMIGKQLNQFVNGYKIYGGYFGSHGKSSKLLAELPETHQNEMKKIEVNIQIQLSKHQSKKQIMTIKDCMQQPLYRLFKYVLLLKQYIKKLPNNHPDFQSVTICHNSFHDINNFNNDLMKRLEDEDKKMKLDKYFGELMRENRILIAEMQAGTIYFDAKLYIFQDIIIITKVQTMLGTVREEKFTNFMINQFSYVAEQEDLKYFKNILILIGQQQCIHLFFADKGSRTELYKCMLKICKDLKKKQYNKRKYGDPNKNTQAKKISFTLQENVGFLLQPEFCVEIIGIQVRPLTKLSNDTAYITRIMIPLYYEDEKNFLESEKIPEIKNQSRVFRPSTTLSSMSIKSQNSQKLHSLPFNYDYDEESNENSSKQSTFKCINQRLQVHFSVLNEIYNTMKTLCPDRLPDIDPITKDVNLYSKGKGKTKFYEMRKFFIQEFFNFIFRHPTIMSNPIWFISKLRINEDLWNYCTDRNSKIKRYEKGSQKKFGYEHCSICKKAQINSLDGFDHYRSYYNSIPNHRANKQADKYCFNFFNLIRIRLLSFPVSSFNTLQRILIFYHYLMGRLDYPFLMHRSNDKSVKVIKINLPSVDQNVVSVMIDTKSTVGEVLDELGNMFKMKNSFDFDLMVIYNGKKRLLERDEYLIDVVKCLSIDFQEVTQDKKQLSKSNDGVGFLDNIKKWGKQMFQDNQMKNKIIFIKTTYLHKTLQLKSFATNLQKKQLQIQKIYWLIKKALIKVQAKQFIELASLYYCLKQLDKIQYFSYSKMSIKTIEKIMPEQYHYIFQLQEKFRKEIGYAIEKQKNCLINKTQNIAHIHGRIIQIVSQKPDYITYFMEVQPKCIPMEYIENRIMPLACLIGVNYKSLIITRTEVSTYPLVVLPIEDVEWSISVFSIFINHENHNFRFDGKMIYHFGKMLKKYQTISKKFRHQLA